MLLLIGAIPGADFVYTRLEQWILFPPLQSFLLNLARETVFHAFMASLIAMFSVMLFNRFAYGAAALIALSIFWRLWPWNPFMHDFHWTATTWAISFYELFSFMMFVALATYLALRPRRFLSWQ